MNSQFSISNSQLTMILHKAIFLDRDGVLNYDSDYAHKIEELVVLPGVKEGLSLLKNAGYKLIIVSNQSGIARGYYNLNDFTNFTLEIGKQTEIEFDAILCCPHHPNDGCECRKPKPGMLLQAAQQFNIDLTQSYMIGDKLSDVQAGKNAGCKTILIGDEKSDTDYACLTLLDAAQAILNYQL